MTDSGNFKVDFIGVGAAKCGTTWVASLLENHPQINFSSTKTTKELNFFNSETESILGKYVQKIV